MTRTRFLTLFGIVLGLGMGRFLHSWTVLTVEVDLVMFGRTAPLYAYCLAAVLTVVFSMAGLFGTTLAPFAGVFGWPFGMLKACLP